MKTTTKIIALAISVLLIGAIVASTLAGADTVVTVDPGWTSGTMPTEQPVDTREVENDMLTWLGGFSRMELVRMILFLSLTDGTLADWLRQEYGDQIDIPESLENLESDQYVAIAMRLFNIKVDDYLGVTTTANGGNETTTGFVFPQIDRPTLEPTTAGLVPAEVTTADGGNTTGQYVELTVIQPQTTTAPVAVDESGSSDIPAGLIRGDVNWDGKILADDARLALRISARLENPSPAAIAAADVNGDRYVLADDARQILRFSAKLQKEFERVAEPASEEVSSIAA
ncbi:MAG: dockerin type I repeat-containing protein [Clostridia bacterium]|nr:dockerin type I repeat-containing protein [Clostridia bacterium]